MTSNLRWERHLSGVEVRSTPENMPTLAFGRQTKRYLTASKPQIDR
jgi:hypothetical protein